MLRNSRLAVPAALLAGALGGWLASSGRLTTWVWAQEKAPPISEGAAGPKAEDAKVEPPELAEVRKTNEAFTRAFNQGDARAVAALWTNEGEYNGPDAEPIRGRAALEKAYTEFFKNHPKATLETHVDTQRLLGRLIAVQEGAIKLRLPGDKEPGESRFSALLVREDDGWRFASAREWVPGEADLVALKDLDWLVGDWEAKGDGGEVRVHYAWDEDRAFLRGRYTLGKDGKVVSSGEQVIGKDPAAGLRSWQFESSGTYAESSWSRDGERWVIQATSTLPDGSQVTAKNLLIPLGKDAFTWQSVERMAAGTPLPEPPPVKVTRVQGNK